MGKYVHVRRIEDRPVDRLRESVLHALVRGDIDPVLAALLARGVERVRTCLHSVGRPAHEIEVPIRHDTLLGVLVECKHRLDQAFVGTDLDVGLVPSKPEAEVWVAMRERLLRTQPEVVRRHKYNLYNYSLSVRPGERLQQVPGMDCSVEAYLNSEAFTDALIARLPKNRAAKPIVLQVHVGGKYLTEADLDRVYGEGPSEKRAAAKVLSEDRGEPLSPEILNGLLTGAFEMLEVKDKTPQEVYGLIREQRADSSKTVVVNSVSHRLDLDSLSLLIPGRVYGWTPATESEAAEAESHGKNILLAGKGHAGKSSGSRERVKAVLLFDRVLPEEAETEEIDR